MTENDIQQPIVDTQSKLPRRMRKPLKPRKKRKQAQPLSAKIADFVQLLKQKLPDMQHRKIHKGRLSLVLTPVVVLVVLIIILCSNFGNPGEIYRSFADKDDHSTEAAEAGRRDAERVLHTAKGSMERDGALLYLHARASALRMNGYETAADDYMAGANELLRSRNIIQ